MRIAAVIVVVVALAAGAASMAGDASASHRSAPIIQRDAGSPIWSPDGKQLLFAYIGYASRRYGLYPTQLRIVRTSSKPGGIHPTDVVHYHRRPLRYADVGSPQWSPDGSRLAFTSVGTTDHVWTVRPNGGNLSRRG